MQLVIIQILVQVVSFFCRFRYYIVLVLACWGLFCLILALIDRTLITPSSAGIRKHSSRRLVGISMISIALFWILFHIHALIFMEILQYGPNYFVCFYQSSTYTTFMTYYSLLINGTLINHSNSMNTRTVVIGRPQVLQSKDQQLIRMLFVDIISYVICKCPITIF